MNGLLYRPRSSFCSHSPHNVLIGVFTPLDLRSRHQDSLHQACLIRRRYVEYLRKWKKWRKWRNEFSTALRCRITIFVICSSVSTSRQIVLCSDDGGSRFYWKRYLSTSEYDAEMSDDRGTDFTAYYTAIDRWIGVILTRCPRAVSRQTTEAVYVTLVYIVPCTGPDWEAGWIGGSLLYRDTISERETPSI